MLQQVEPVPAVVQNPPLLVQWRAVHKLSPLRIKTNIYYICSSEIFKPMFHFTTGGGRGGGIPFGIPSEGMPFPGMMSSPLQKYATHKGPKQGGDSEFYDTLGVTDFGASQDDLKKAFRKMSVKMHPDRQGGSTEEFQKLNTAYESLSNKVVREIYDKHGKEAANDQEVVEFAKHVKKMEERRQNHVPTTQDIELAVKITLLEAFKGCSKTMVYERIVIPEWGSAYRRTEKDSMTVHVPPGTRPFTELARAKEKSHKQHGARSGDVVAIAVLVKGNHHHQEEEEGGESNTGECTSPSEDDGGESSKTASDKTVPDKTASDKTASDKTASDKTVPDEDFNIDRNTGDMLVDRKISLADSFAGTRVAVAHPKGHVLYADTTGELIRDGDVMYFPCQGFPPCGDKSASDLLVRFHVEFPEKIENPEEIGRLLGHVSLDERPKPPGEASTFMRRSSHRQNATHEDSQEGNAQCTQQ
jgi:DnaJ-class molecular chaperone